MRKKYARLSTVSVLMLCGSTAVALPFSTFDPRSMAMGSTGVAVNDPALAPFFNPAMLSASDPSKRASIEFVNLGVSLIDPGNLHTNWTNVNNAATSLTNTGTALTTNANTLSTNAATLTTNITTLSTNITNLGSITIIDAATAAAALSSMKTVSTNLPNVTTSMTTVSGNVTTVGNNVNTVSSNISTINQVLQNMNNQPLQGELGAATVIGIPNKNWGIAVYADTWAAMGGALVYKDAATVSTITTATSTVGTNLTGIGTATGSAATTLATANTSLGAAITSCTNVTAGTLAACQAALTQATTDLGKAQTTVATTSSTVTTNSNNITAAANSVNTNKTMQSQVHIRGVAVTEYGLALSHGVVTNDVEWAWGITPKVMQLRLYDATISATSSTSNLTGNDYLAYYSTLNFDAGLAKTYLSGWRSGIVVKNVIPQTFDFKNAPSPGAIPVATGSTLKLNPQVRAGFGYEAIGLFSVALDADLTRNDPAGLEAPSQFLALGTEVSTAGWVQIRAGYRADMVNAARNIASFGFGLSPRLPFFKPHFDFAITASPDIFNNSIDTATQVGASMKFGLNF